MYTCLGKSASHRVIIAVVCTLAALGTIGGITASVNAPHAVVAASAQCQEWGLSFQTKGEPPIPNLSAETLLPYDAYYCAPVGAKRLYITFDAGFENGNTPAILDALAAHGAKAAFFVVEPYLRENTSLVQRMVSEGHLVCNHTHHHPNMTQKGKADFTQELDSVKATYKELIGSDMPMYYRPPEGKFSTDNLQWAQELGYTTVLWSLAYKDWVQGSQPDKAAAISKIMSRTHDGAVILLHATSSTNAAIMDELLTQWQAQGYSFGTLDDLKAA